MIYYIHPSVVEKGGRRRDGHRFDVIPIGHAGIWPYPIASIALNLLSRWCLHLQEDWNNATITGFFRYYGERGKSYLASIEAGTPSLVLQ